MNSSIHQSLFPMDEAALFFRITALVDKNKPSPNRRIRLSEKWSDEIHGSQWRKFEVERVTRHTRFVGKAYEYLYPEDIIGVQVANLHDMEEDGHKHIQFLQETINTISEGHPIFITTSYRQSLGPLIREFLEKRYGLKINRAGRFTANPSFEIPKEKTNPSRAIKEALNHAYRTEIRDGITVTVDEFAPFFREKIHADCGHDVQYGIWILSRLSHEDKYNFSFVDPRIRFYHRRRAATIKCLDVWHNLRTLDFSSEEGIEHAHEALTKSIRLIPYLGHSADPRAFVLAYTALEKAYKQLQAISTEAADTSLQEKMAPAYEHMEGQLAKFTLLHRRGILPEFAMHN